MRVEIWRSQTDPQVGWAQHAEQRAQQLLANSQTAAVTHPLVAEDLSGNPLVFRRPQRERFAVRPAVAGDIPYLCGWRQTPHISQWWGSVDPQQLQDTYRERLTSAGPVNVWIWEVNGRSIGFAQDYWLPADQTPPGVPTGEQLVVGVDFAIGEVSFASRGLGTGLLWTYLREVVLLTRPGARYIFADPDHRNSASQRVLRKLGFEPLLWVDQPETEGGVVTKVLYLLDVAQVFGPPATSR